MYGKSRVKVKVEPHSTFTITRDLSYITFISFTHVKITPQWKSITRQWNQPHVNYTREVINFYFYARSFIHCLSFICECKFSARTHVSFTRVNKIETMYGRSRINVKVEPRSSFTFTSVLSYIASILFTRVKLTRVYT